VIRFFDSNVFVYYIPTGEGIFFKDRFLWEQILKSPIEKFDLVFFMQHGELLPSCHHPKLKQMIFENTIKSCEEVSPRVEENPTFSITFVLNGRKSKPIVSSPSGWNLSNHPWSTYTFNL